MRTVEVFRANAEECRKLAKLMTKPEDRKIVELLAGAWERLAERRALNLKEAD